MTRKDYPVSLELVNMTTGKITSAKITRPPTSKAIQRKRLFSLLDVKVEKPVVWVSAPAGSGKTTLVSSYLDSRKLPFIWYQCDEGDSDPATFFYYMGLAAKKVAPRNKNPLPLLTPECLASTSDFSRRYFEKLFTRTPLPDSQLNSHGFMLILDNYQDVRVGSPFQDMVASGFDVIPEGVHVVVLSRGEPPPALARLLANDKINLLRYSDICFTFDELIELAHERNPNLNDEYIKAIHEKAKGWAAGIILMLERGEYEGTDIETASGFAYERVFDYFAGEIFNRSEKDLQNFMLKTAVLPVLSVAMAEKLTGVESAERILIELHRLNFFTERLSGNGLDYQYHPLFRDFLLNRAKSLFSHRDLVVLYKEAALLLDHAGQTEDAARLFSAAGDWDSLTLMVLKHARELLAQGRYKTVEEWIAAIPGKMVDDNPWLLYWTGICSFAVNMSRARKFLEKAFALFRAKNDISGVYLSWAGIVDTYAFGLDEWRRLDYWITVFNELLRAYPSFPSKEIDLMASSRMLISLTLRNTDQPQWVHSWLQRVNALLQENPSLDIQMDTVFCMNVYYLWKGEYHKNAVLLEKAATQVRYCNLTYITIIRIKLMMGIHYWITARYNDALKTLSEGLDISDKNGIHVLDSLLWGFCGAVELARGNLELAEESLNKQMTSLLDVGTPLDLYFYHINSAWCAILKGNQSLATEHMETVSSSVEKMGTPYYRALWHIGMAQIAFLRERARDAKAHVRTAHHISLAMKSHVMEWYSLLIDAWFLLHEGKRAKGVQSLRYALTLGRKHGYTHLEFYQPAIMRYLMAQALEEGIERDYVKGLIKKLDLCPPLTPNAADSASYIEEWPYPVKIYTLGRFEILMNDELLHFSGKEQKKPLEMLKVLIALGGADVAEERLTDALWPNADGDLAHKSFETTLGRLRRLLGCEEFIKYRAHQLTINALFCWVDSFALGHLLEKIVGAPPDLAVPLWDKAVCLYKGPFLAADMISPWAQPCRETLKNRLLRVIIKRGRRFEQTGEWEKALENYTKGIDVDSLTEELYRRLMVCYRELGSRTDAVKTFNRCRRVLQSELGIEPSSETKIIYSSIIKQ